MRGDRSVKWHRRPKVRAAARAVIAAALGAAFGAFCAYLPEEFRPLCRTVGDLAGAIFGVP